MNERLPFTLSDEEVLDLLAADAMGWHRLVEKITDLVNEHTCCACLRQRLYVALVEQRVIDSQKYGEAPYAPITWEDVDRVIPPRED